MKKINKLENIKYFGYKPDELILLIKKTFLEFLEKSKLDFVFKLLVELLLWRNC